MVDEILNPTPSPRLIRQSGDRAVLAHKIMKNDIMNTYRELMAVKNMDWPSNHPSVKPDREVMEFTKKNGRREGLLYNNRILFGYINPSQKRKTEYEVNRKWILSNFPN